MGYKTPDFPPVDPAVFLAQPLSERIRQLALHWVQFGTGTPRNVAVMYIYKLVLLYIVAGTVIITLTSGLGMPWDIGSWWNQPLFYQKLVIWTMLLEAIGIAGAWGPMNTRFHPKTGGILYWMRPGTIRLAPFSWVPGTKGSYRKPIDIVLYVTLLVSLAVALLLPGQPSASLSAMIPSNTSGLVATTPLIVTMVVLVLLGLRDKIIFLAARSDQYLPALLFFTVLPFVDMIMAIKIMMAVIWIGAGVSKLGLHFMNVVPAMVSNTPFWPPKWLKRSMYREFPNDLRPSGLARFLADGLGAGVEIIAPIVLLFSPWPTLSIVFAILLACYHLFIISTFPLAVPLEWNVLYAYVAIGVFLGFPNWAGYSVVDFSNGWLLALIVIGLLIFPVLGNFRPDKISFLPSMRQYAGNWACSTWTFTPGAEDKLNEMVIRPAKQQFVQLQQMGLPAPIAEITLQQIITFRAMHSQGRGLYSVLYRSVPDIETRVMREGENMANSLIGFSFGDGHLHNESLIAAVQERCNFAPGELIVVLVESQPIHKKTQKYRLVDAALGELERGSWIVRDAVNEQPWLPNGPIPVNVEWKRAQ